MPTDTLRKNPMMAHLLDALDEGHDIGHYGRLTFAIVGQYFMDEDALVRTLAQDGDFSEADARALVQQVEAKGYNPPSRSTLTEWQGEQDFPIIPNPDDPDQGNVYADLDFPDEVYESIEAYRREQAEA